MTDQNPATAPTPPESALRVGHGYDKHRLEPVAPLGPGRPMILGGVRLAHDRGPVGHSDGDALYHAITDALLGALALPDIGELFPDTDPENEARDSADFLQAAVKMLHQLQWRAVNLDCTVILERPKLKDHKHEMRKNIARIVGIDVDAVNVKGKTGERVDAVGEGRAVEVHVVALLEKVSQKRGSSAS